MWPRPEHLWSFVVPVRERADGRSAPEDGLWQLALVEAGMTRRIVCSRPSPLRTRWLCRISSMWPLNRSPMQLVCGRIGGGRRCSMPRSAQGRSESWLPAAALAQTQEPVGELLAPRPCLSDLWRSNGSTSQHPGNPHRRGTLGIAQEAPGICDCLRRQDAHKDPSRGTVDGHEKIPPVLAVPSRGRYLTSMWREPGAWALKGLCPGLGTAGLRSRRLPALWRRRQWSSLGRETLGLRNSRTTESRSSSGSRRAWRRATAAASCAGVSTA